MNIHVSEGNMKVGKIPNISIRPVLDCGNCSGCKDKCYAMKSYRQYPNVRKNWDENSEAFREDPSKACLLIDYYLAKKSPKYFRIHVAGDFLNQEHVNAWIKTAKVNGQTKFLTHTKMYNLDFSKVPDNMNVIYSIWPGMEDTAPEGRRAYLTTDDRLPKKVFHCVGKCDKCKVCWNSPKDVCFKLH